VEEAAAEEKETVVQGAASSIAASIAAVEGIKVLSGFGETLAGTLLYYDSRFMARGPFCLILGTTGCSNFDYMTACGVSG
jgi:hypothetical protein